MTRIETKDNAGLCPRRRHSERAGYARQSAGTTSGIRKRLLPRLDVERKARSGYALYPRRNGDCETLLLFFKSAWAKGGDDPDTRCRVPPLRISTSVANWGDAEAGCNRIRPDNSDSWLNRSDDPSKAIEPANRWSNVSESK